MRSVMKVSILIPAYNEERTILEAVRRVLDAPFPTDKEVIVIDDGSTDGTARALANVSAPGLTILRLPVNRGKGAAVRAGIERASGDVVVVQDGDLEYSPQDYPVLLKPIADGKADVVYGSRFLGGAEHRVLLYWHSVGNKFLTCLSNMFTNLNLSDMETCYKLFRADIIKSLDLKENRFGFEPEVTAKIARIPGVRIYEVGISYYGRTYEEGKKINWRDGLKAVYCIMRYNLFGS